MLGIFDINLIIISFICSFLGLGFLYLTRDIKTAMGGGAYDNDLMIHAASKSNEWRWLSDMHTKTYTGTATSQKDLTIILLAIFQKIFRDKNGEFPIIALWGFAHIASAFLIYLIGSSYWGPNVGLLISLLYLSSFWMWQISLFVGHLNVATMFFLLAVYCLTQAVGASPFLMSLLIFVSGIYFCCMLFSSSSSLRYAVLFFIAVFWTKYQIAGQELNLNGFYRTIENNHTLFVSFIFTLIFVFLLFIIKCYYKKIITAIYERRAWFLNGIISAKKYPLENYLQRTEEQLPNILKWSVKFYTFLFILINLIGFDYFIPISTSFVLVFLILTLPNIKRSFTFYFNYFYISYMKPGINSSFVRPIKQGYFAKRGINISPLTRGGGIEWVFKIFFKLAPLHTLIYATTLAMLFYFNFTSEQLPISSGLLIALTLVSLLPILWAEITKAYQVSRSYSSGLIGFFIIIGFGTFVFQPYLYFWPIAVGILGVTYIWNLWKFFGIIYPARISFNKIIGTLNKFNIKEFYTYDTPYSLYFLYNIKNTPSLKNLKVNFIKSIRDVKNGWIFIPATSHKGGYIPEGSFMGGDFTEDPVLNELLETKEIEKISNAKFKTICGSDDIWRHESDLITYMDLMLHDITDRDRFRGYAWLLHLKNGACFKYTHMAV